MLNSYGGTVFPRRHAKSDYTMAIMKHRLGIYDEGDGEDMKNEETKGVPEEVQEVHEGDIVEVFHCEESPEINGEEGEVIGTMQGSDGVVNGIDLDIPSNLYGSTSFLDFDTDSFVTIKEEGDTEGDSEGDEDVMDEKMVNGYEIGDKVIVVDNEGDESYFSLGDVGTVIEVHSAGMDVDFREGNEAEEGNDWTVALWQVEPVDENKVSKGNIYVSESQRLDMGVSEDDFEHEEGKIYITDENGFTTDILTDDPADVPVSDSVNHPSHYNAGNIETIEMIEEITRNYYDGYLGLTVGNAIKYLSRAPLKHGDVEEDLKKAARYIQYALEYLEK